MRNENFTFTDDSEMQGALKNYLECGKFGIAHYQGSSEAGLMLLALLLTTLDGMAWGLMGKKPPGNRVTDAPAVFTW